jgi:hypothetical protein
MINKKKKITKEEKLEKKIEKIHSQFSNIIREEMTDKQFWKWVSEWYDVDIITNEAEEWSWEDKLDAIKDFNNLIKK